MLYELLTNCIPADVIMKTLLKELCGNLDDELKHEVSVKHSLKTFVLSVSFFLFDETQCHSLSPTPFLSHTHSLIKGCVLGGLL